MNRLNRILIAAGLSIACLASATASAQVNPSFTYQGKLERNNAPVTGTYQFYFLMYDTPNGLNVVGNYGNHDNPITISVDKGLFTQELQFPASVFNGSERYLDVVVRSDENSAWTPLTPRQRISPAPYASFAAAIAGTGIPANDYALFGSSESFAGFKMTVRTESNGILALVSPDHYAATLALVNESSGGKNWSILSTGQAFPNGGTGQFIVRDVLANANRLTIDGSGTIGLNGAVTVLSTGAVGIGTSAPDRELVIDQPLDQRSIVAIDSGSTTMQYSALDLRDRGTAIWGMGKGNDNAFYIDRTGIGRILHIDPDSQNVGIKTGSPGSFTLAVNGTAAKPGGGSWSTFCDSRLKHDIKPLAGTLDKLLKLRGYTFQYHQDAIEKRMALPGDQLGLIAEEVQQVFPDWVETDADGYRYVTERATTALMVEALRDLRSEKDTQIESLKSANDRLQAESEALRVRLERLEAALNTTRK